MKKIFILLFTTLLLAGCSTCDSNNQIGIYSSGESDFKITNQQLTVVGSDLKIIDSEALNNLPKYNIVAGVDDNYSVMTKTYKAIKLKDLIDSIAPKTYNTIYFSDDNHTSLWIPKSYVDDNAYLIIEDKQMIVANFNKLNYSWLYNVKTIDFTREGA